MSFIETTDQFQKWKYKISEFYVLYPDGAQTEIQTNRIRSMSLIHLFETHLFPIFKFELVLSAQTYYKIIKNKKNVKFKLRVQKYFTEIDSDEKSLSRDWINDTFDLILDDDDFNSDETLLKEQKENDYDNIVNKELENDIFKVDNVMEFFLFKSELIDKLNTTVNAIISNATINDAIQYIATQSNLNNILMSPINNTKVYKELVIPPLKTKQAIRFLDTYYGLYNNGMMFYCDTIDSTTYILSYTRAPNTV